MNPGSPQINITPFYPFNCSSTHSHLLTAHFSFAMDEFDFSFSGSLLDANTTQRELTEDGKDVHLFNGNIIHLKKKATRPPPDTTTISGSFMDTEALFAKAELANRIKANNAELSCFTPQTSTLTEVWTEKYRPKRYLDLCSAGNDKAYRQLFTWLKDWGAPTTDHPRRKILLVHGPPGMGKTLAVNICTRQLGYHLEELNAANSMDQLPQSSAASFEELRKKTSSALRLRITNALSSNTIFSVDKPTCLVIDEIDLTTNAVDIVRVLGDILRDDARAGKGQKKLAKRLLRPIICIANDIYPQGNRHLGAVMAMERLRPLCDIVAFKKPVKTGIRAIKEHLQWVCDKEGLKLDNKGLSSVVEMCDADIRACINHLQFASRATSLTGNYMDGLVVWGEMVELLFKHSPKERKEAMFANLVDLFLGETARAAPVIDKVMRGVFNRYLDYEDNAMQKPLVMADWFADYDIICPRGQDTLGLGYGCIAALKVWSTYYDVSRLKLAEPVVADARSLEFNTFEAMRSNMGAAELVWNRLPLELKRSLGLLSLPEFVTMAVPLISEFLHPHFLSKAKLNLLAQETAKLETATHWVKQLDFRLETTADLVTGVHTLNFNPNLDGFRFGEDKLVQKKRINLFALLQAELDAKKGSKRPLALATTNTPAPKRAKATVDFFKDKYSEVATTQTAPEPAMDRIWVKYNEGFLNAVRKKIGWEELWGK